VKVSVELRHDALQLYRAMTRAAQEGSDPSVLAEVARQNATLQAEQESIGRLSEADRNAFDAVGETVTALSALAADMAAAPAQEARQESWHQSLRQLQERLPLFDACL